MKLKKIASLMLAGVMAVSMLAGCKNNGNGQPLPPDDDENTTNYSTMLGNKVSDDVKKLNYISFANDSNAQSALERALGNLGYVNSTRVTLPDPVVNLCKEGDGTLVDYNNNLAGAINALGEDSIIAVIDDFVDDMDIKNDWLDVEGITNNNFNRDNDNTESSVCGALYVVDGSVAMDKVLNTIASQMNGQLEDLPNTSAVADGAFNVTYDYTVSVSVVNRAVSAIDWLNVSANFIAVTVTRVPTQA